MRKLIHPTLIRTFYLARGKCEPHECRTSTPGIHFCQSNTESLSFTVNAILCALKVIPMYTSVFLPIDGKFLCLNKIHSHCFRLSKVLEAGSNATSTHRPH